MLYCYSQKIPIKTNKNLVEYCKSSTQQSVKKLIEKYNLERNIVKINNPLEDNNDNKPKINYIFLIFLSVSTMGYFLYKRLH